MDLRALRYFVAVAEELHFARAATRLHMTQPPLSQAILALEQEFGHALFLRNKRQVSLTAAGNALLPQARRLLAEADELPRLVARAAQGEVGSLHLGFVSSVDYGLLPPLLRQYRQLCPQVDLQLREATSDVQWQELLAERLDVGLLIPPLPAAWQDQFHYLPLQIEDLILAAPADLDLPPTADGAQLLRLAAALPLLIFPRKIAPGLHDTIVSCLRELGLTPASGQQAIQMQTIIALVSAGLGFALVPQSLSNLQRSGVQYRALGKIAPRVETGAAWLRRQDAPVVQGFLQLLRQFAAQGSSQFCQAM